MLAEEESRILSYRLNSSATCLQATTTGASLASDQLAIRAHRPLCPAAWSLFKSPLDQGIPVASTQRTSAGVGGAWGGPGVRLGAPLG